MINPFGDEEFANPPRGRGLRGLKGDFEPGLRPLPGDEEPGISSGPGDFRFAGDKIKGLNQLDPTIFAKLFA